MAHINPELPEYLPCPKCHGFVSVPNIVLEFEDIAMTPCNCMSCLTIYALLHMPNGWFSLSDVSLEQEKILLKALEDMAIEQEKKRYDRAKKKPNVGSN